MLTLYQGSRSKAFELGGIQSIVCIICGKLFVTPTISLSTSASCSSCFKIAPLLPVPPPPTWDKGPRSVVWSNIFRNSSQEDIVAVYGPAAAQLFSSDHKDTMPSLLDHAKVKEIREASALPDNVAFRFVYTEAPQPEAAEPAEVKKDPLYDLLFTRKD